MIDKITIWFMYVILNLGNNKVYIGQTVNTKARWYDEHWELSSGIFNSCAMHPLQQSWQLHGESNFEWVVFEICDTQEEADAREIELITEYRALDMCYNVNNGGTKNSRLGIPHTEETKAKMSKAHLGQPGWSKGITGIYTEERRKEISEFMKSRPVSDSTKEKRRLAMLGKTHSEISKERMSISSKNKPKSETHKESMSKARKGKPWTEARRIAQEKRKKI